MIPHGIAIEEEMSVVEHETNYDENADDGEPKYEIRVRKMVSVPLYGH